MQEIWKKVMCFGGIYQNRFMVSNFGRIKSIDVVSVGRNGDLLIKKGKMLNPSPSSNGYKTVALSFGEYGYSVLKTKTLHRIVAEHFIPNPENKRCVNHKNGNKTDNNVENLEWVTYKENSNHAYKTKLIRSFTPDYNEILILFKEQNKSAKELSEIYNVHIDTIYNYLNKTSIRKKKQVNYINKEKVFKYKKDYNWTATRIAKELNCDISAVCRIIKKGENI